MSNGSNPYLRIIKRLDELVKSRFVEMFGDPIKNSKGWEKKKLRDLLLIERGGSPRPIDDFITEDENGLNWIKIGDAKEGSYYIESVKEKIKPEGLKKTREVEPGDLLLSNSMSFGKPYIMKIPGCIHDGWLVLRDSKDRFNKLFLCIALGYPSVTQAFKGSARGAVVNNLNKDLVGALEFIVPPRDLQDRFIEFVNQVDKSKVIAQKAAEKYEKLVKSRFIEMFGNPVTNDKNWKTEKLKSITTKIGSGATPTGGRSAYNGTEIALVRSMNVHDSQFDYEDLAYITDNQAASLSNVELKKSDVLLNITGASVARCCVIPDDVLPGRVNQHVCIIRPDSNIIDPYFLNYLLTSGPMKSYLLTISKSNGATREAITKEIVEKLSIILPPISTQKEFNSFVQQSINRNSLSNRIFIVFLLRFD